MHFLVFVGSQADQDFAGLLVLARLAYDSFLHVARVDSGASVGDFELIFQKIFVKIGILSLFWGGRPEIDLHHCDHCNFMFILGQPLFKIG